MNKHADIQRIIEHAKQRRAELIGRSIGKHPVIALVCVAIPVLLTTMEWSPFSPVAVEMPAVSLHQSARV
jgi:alkylation response protein AidB-like acyl-CoA dehydrogenase